MQLIQEASGKDVTYLDIPILQLIIDFKWETYTKAYFMIEFIKAIIFVVTFLIDLILVSPEGFQIKNSYEYWTACIVTRSICIVYMIDFAFHEFIQLRA